MFVYHECTNFQNIQEPPQNSTCKNGDMKQVSNWGSRNIRHYSKKFAKNLGT